MTDALFLINDPIFKWIWLACNIIAFIIWVLNILTQNLSHVDRLWSIMPAVYAWLFVFTNFYFRPSSSSQYAILENSETSDLRLIIIAVLVSMWAARLTYNFWRKGGFEFTHEEYRWMHVRKMFNYPQSKLTFHIFVFVFVSFMQNWLLLGLVMPMWFIQTNINDPTKRYQAPLNIADLFVTVLFLFFFIIEIISDQQQWNYQTAKYEWINEQKLNQGKSSKKNYTPKQIEDFKRGFLINGLFKYSRHPNFFGEIFLWWTIYLFSLSSQFDYLSNNFSASSIINYTIGGVVFLTLIFQGSTDLTEKISQSKYPEYSKYKARVNRWVPFFTTYKPIKSK